MARTLIATKTRTIRHDLGTELAFIASEQERIATERKINADLVAHVEDDLGYERWKREHGIVPLDRAAYEVLFDPHCLTR
jgi:hypothetical protein